MAGSGKIANLSIGVSADTAEFTNGLSKAQAAAADFQKKMDAKSIAIGVAIGQNIGEGLKTVVMAFPQAFAAAADSLDAFNDLKDVTSASIGNISALDAIGRRTGATFEDVSSSLIKFNKTLGEAGDNVKGDIFKELGLDLQALKAMDPAKAFQATAVALAGVENNAEKSQVLLELFGKSAAQLAPFLNDVAEAGELVATATDEQAAAAEAYNKAIFGMNAAAQDATRVLASELMPVLTEVIKVLGQSGTAVEVFGEIVKAVFQTVAVVGSDVGFVFMGVGREIAAWGAQLTALASGDLQGFSAISDAVKRDGERARVELGAFQRRVLNIGKSLQDLGVPEASYSNEGRGKGESKAPGLTDPAELDKRRKAEEEAAKARKKAAEDAATAQQRADEAARKYIDAINKQIDKATELSAVEKVADDIMRGRVKFRDAAQAGEAVAAAAELDAHRRLKSQLEEEERVWNAVKEARESAAASIRDTIATDYERYAAKVEEANKLVAAGAITEVERSKYIEKLGQDYLKLGDAAKTLAEQQTAAAEEAERQIQNSLGDELKRSLSGDFEDIGKRWKNLILNMLADAAAADLANALLGKSAPSQTGALLDGLFKVGSAYFGGSTNTGFGTGSQFGNQDYGAFLATGTNYVPYDGFKATLHEGEAVVPKKYNPSAGGFGAEGTSFFANQTIYVGSNVSMADVRAQVEAANAQSEARIRRSITQQR